MTMSATETAASAGITIEGLTKVRRGKKHRDDRVIFERFSLTVAPNEIVTILGRNGSGKSTLLRILAGMDSEIDVERLEPKAQSRNGDGRRNGQLTLVTAAISTYDPSVRMARRSRPWVSVASQDYKSVLLPWYTVRRNLIVAAEMSRLGRSDREVNDVVNAAIGRF